MAKKYREYNELLSEQLQDSEVTLTYLNAAFHDEDQRIFLLALKNVLEAKCDDITAVVPEQEEKWLCDPENKIIVEKLKEALKEKANRKINLSLFEEKDSPE